VVCVLCHVVNNAVHLSPSNPSAADTEETSKKLMIHGGVFMSPHMVRVKSKINCLFVCSYTTRTHLHVHVFPFAFILELS
jgi:hypothetical protein